MNNRFLENGYVISIHAPPRGATRSLYRALALSAYFNSRPSARGDGLRLQRFTKSIYFNSRPSARGDVNDFAALNVVTKFQFTPLREGRLMQHLI